MKGRNIFTAPEADSIRELPHQIRQSEPERQKALRDKLQADFGFYISDFPRPKEGFSLTDFDSLVARGAITIR